MQRTVVCDKMIIFFKLPEFHRNYNKDLFEQNKVSQYFYVKNLASIALFVEIAYIQYLNFVF